jgi:putative transposase
MYSYELYSHNHQKGYWEYHLQWCPKYRKPIFADEAVKETCVDALREAAEEKGIQLAELAVMHDHVHAVAVTKKPMQIAKLLFYLKGKTSRVLMQKHPELQHQYWGGHIWARSAFSRTVGLDGDKARRYVKEQHDIHQRRLTAYI